MQAGKSDVLESQVLPPQPLRLIRVVRWFVLGLILLAVGSLVASIALFPPTLTYATSSLAPNTRWTPEMTQSALDQLGWSPQALAWFFAILGWITGLVSLAVGLIVIRRRANSWFGLYVAFTFAVLLTSMGAPQLVRAQGGGLLAGWYNFTGDLAWQFLIILFYLFPDGHFTPSWTRWLMPLWVFGYVTSKVAPSASFLLVPLGALLVVSALVSQIYRYVRVSNDLQRQQTKWIVFMGGAFLLFVTPGLLTFSAITPPGANLAAGLIRSVIVTTFADLWILCVPIVIGMAILRYRLWDIDIIIRRTLVYLPLSAILAGVFAASIKILQTLFSPLFGDQSGAATALTTLIVVAAFDPIKGWLQRFVDARFKDTSNPLGRWKAYNEQVRAFVQMNDTQASAQRFLEEAVAMFDAQDGAVYLQEGEGNFQLVHTLGPHQVVPEILIPLDHLGSLIGHLDLGARRNRRPYSLNDRNLLLQTANAVATAIALANVKNAYIQKTS